MEKGYTRVDGGSKRLEEMQAARGGEQQEKKKGHKHWVREKNYTLVEGTTTQGVQARGEGPRGGGAGVYKGLAG